MSDQLWTYGIQAMHDKCSSNNHSDVCCFYTLARLNHIFSWVAPPKIQWLATPKQICSHFPHNSQNSYDYRSELYLVLIKLPCRSSQLSWLLSTAWLLYFVHVVQSLLDTSFWCPFLNHIFLKCGLGFRVSTFYSYFRRRAIILAGDSWHSLRIIHPRYREWSGSN